MLKSRGKYDSSLVHVVKVQYNQLLTKYVHNHHISCTCIHTGIHMYTCVCMDMCVCVCVTEQTRSQKEKFDFLVQITVDFPIFFSDERKYSPKYDLN